MNAILPPTSPTAQALCCECGNLRTFKKGAPLRNWTSEGVSPEHIAQVLRSKDVYATRKRPTKAAARGRAYWESRVPYERHLCDLKCVACGAVTRHAIVRPAGLDSAAIDRAELDNYGLDIAWNAARGAFDVVPRSELGRAR